MGAEQGIDWRQVAASALAWWDEAGVDTLVEETPRDWLRAPVAPVRSAPTPAAEPEALPATFDAFAIWRASAAAPESDWPGAWIAASGPANAGLMVLVDCPDRGDERDGLLSGKAGMLFDRMLAAIGLARAEVHLASVCAKRPIAGRIPAAMEERLAASALLHVGLVAPKRLLLLGKAASRAILGTDVLDARGKLHVLNHEGGQTGGVASFHPRFLLENPARKAEAWADLQMLMRGMEK